MKKLLISFFVLILIYINLFFPNTILANIDPLNTANNAFGIHILDENDLNDASNLVNSSGGTWGYVTFVIRKDERDFKRWQQVFNRMRKLHLIPIVRIATRQQDGGWEKPNFDEIDGWVSFLNSLNWVIKNRYIIIGNEPNHAKEWGNELNPKEYAEYLYQFSKKIRASSDEFFILPAALDASSPNNKIYMSEEDFIKEMIKYKSDIFNYVDGWNSHSYPNPDFSGSETDNGRGSIKTYEWELNLIKSLGVEKNLPIFITETGWAHNKNTKNKGYKSPESISKSIKYAFEFVWNDKRIVAVTPFILNYQQPPFDIFSWKKNNSEFYDFFFEVQKIPKNSGKPIQKIVTKIISMIFPPIFKRNSKLYGLALIKNTGQSIWKWGEYINSENTGKNVQFIPILLLFGGEPGQKSLAVIRIST